MAWHASSSVCLRRRMLLVPTYLPATCYLPIPHHLTSLCPKQAGQSICRSGARWSCLLACCLTLHPPVVWRNATATCTPVHSPSAPLAPVSPFGHPGLEPHSDATLQISTRHTGSVDAQPIFPTRTHTVPVFSRTHSSHTAVHRRTLPPLRYSSLSLLSVPGRQPTSVIPGQ